MPTTSFPAARMTVGGDHRIDPTGHGLRVLPGARGYAFYGPYASVRAGVYRVFVEVALSQPETAASLFDVYADGAILASRVYRERFELFLWIGQTSGLEFRFRTRGEGIELHRVDLEPLLLDAEPADAEALYGLIDGLAQADVEPGAMLRLFDRLALAGQAEAAEARRSAWVAGCPAVRVRRALRELHGEARADMLPSPFSRGQLAPVVADETLNIFDAFSLTHEDNTALRALGYEPALLQATRSGRPYSRPPFSWQLDGMAHEDLPGERPRSPVFRKQDHTDLAFQLALADGDGLTAYCPVTGERLVSKHGFLVQYFGFASSFTVSKVARRSISVRARRTGPGTSSICRGYRSS